MTCEQFRKTLSEVPVLEATDTLRRQINLHMKNCRRCSEYLRSLPFPTEGPEIRKIKDLADRDRRRYEAGMN